MFYYMLRNEGHVVNHKRIRRIYRASGLVLFRKRRRRLPPRERTVLPATKVSDVWSVDFVHDALTDGRSVRVLTVIDDATRIALAATADHSLPAARVIRELDYLCEIHGPPRNIRSDNGPEFISAELQRWARDRGINWHFIQPGKPAQNCFVERFNGTLRRDVLAATLFVTLSQMRQRLDETRHIYNTLRPHRSLRGKPPAVLASNSLVMRGLA